MSELPKGWTNARLADLGTWCGGGTPSKSRPEFWTNGTIPWVSPKDMKVYVIGDAEDHITENAVSASATNIVPADSVLAVTRSGILRRTFPVAVTTSPVAINQDLKALKPGIGIDPRYVAWYLRSDEQSILHDCSKDGTTVDSIDSTALLRWVIPVAPQAEQIRIVTAIEEQFSRLDVAVTALNWVQGRLEGFSHAIVTNALKGGWTENIPFNLSAAKIIDAKSAKRRTSRRRSSEALMPVEPLPEGWAWTTLDEVAADRPHALKAGPFGSALKKEFYVDHGYKIYGQEQVIRGDASYGDYYISEQKYKSLASCAVRPRDLLISLVGTIGRTLILGQDAAPGIINPRLIKVSLDEEVMTPEFLTVVLQSPAVRARLKLESHGETMDVINLSILRYLPIPCPPPEHQAVIVERLSMLGDLVEHFRAAMESAHVRAAMLRRSLLTAAFSGGLVSQDASDEPAALLFERIAQERASSNDKSRVRSRKRHTQAQKDMS